MALKISLSKYRILIMAVGLSFAMHCFWLSAIKIAVAPESKKEVRFSKVSFLGPILTKISTEVRISPRTRSFLEERYNSIGKNTDKKTDLSAGGAYLKYDAGSISEIPGDESMVRAIDAAVSGSKLEPAPNS